MGPAERPPFWPVSVRWFHWLSAVAIVTMLALGTLMVRLDDVGLRFNLYQQHKTIGALVLILTIARLANRVRSGGVSGATGGSRLFAALVHGTFYVLIVAVALSGWVMVSASPLPIPISIFGLFDLPNIVGPDLALSRLAQSCHGVLTKLLMLLVVLHAGAALKHHLRDGDDVLRRMWR